jgi:hypothetical protein
MTPGMMSGCTVWFYNPAQESISGASFVNKLVAGLYPPFCHTELQFPNGEACSIVMNGTVRLRERTFDEGFYSRLDLCAPRTAVDKALRLAQRHVEQKTAFGMSASCTFCSKLVAELLSESGIVPRQSLPDPHLMSPSTLYYRLHKLREVVRHPEITPITAPISTRITPISFAQPLASAHQLTFVRR